MKFVLITKDGEVVEAAKRAFPPSDELRVYAEWHEALEACDGADVMFVDLIATLEQPHKIAGYEKFALAKMDHPVASKVPLILFAPPADYDLDSMMGWPDFVQGQYRRPIDDRIFRRASSYF